MGKTHKIQIREVVEEMTDVWVRIESEMGAFWAIWGHGTPTVGHSYHVEMDVDEPLRDWQPTMEISANAFAIRGNERGSPIVMTGRVLRVFPEQKTARIEMGEFTIEVEFNGQAPPESWIHFQTSRLKAYDANY